MKPSFPLAWLLSLLLMSAGAAQSERDPQAPEPDRAGPESQDFALRVAASQHLLITILLDEGDYDSVPAEFDKILELGLEGPRERLVTQAAWKIVERLREARRFSLAHEMVDKTLDQAAEAENRFSLLMLRAKIFQDQRLLQQAIEAVREAQALDRERVEVP
jgi:tetratricopeptide (TPR) repeat protein